MTTPPLVAPVPYNATAWQQLADAPPASGNLEAVLLEYDLSNGEDGKPAWQFLINPRSLQYREAAAYTAVSPHASPVPYQHYSGSSGATLTISDLVMSTYIYGKSLRPLIEGLKALLVAKPESDIFAPPLLLFSMGTLRFGPCVLTAIDRNESAWLSGETARATLSITLQEVPRPLTEAEKAEREHARQEREAAAREQQDLPRQPLTERQREEVSAEAKRYLSENVTQFNDEVQSAIRTNRYSLQTNAQTGQVTMLNADGKAMGVVLRSTGREFLSGGTHTTLPRVQGTTAPAEQRKPIVNQPNMM